MKFVVFSVAITFIALAASTVAYEPEAQAQRGCCSSHQGVCGCLGGRTQCCDGTASPSCACRAEEPSCE